MISDGQSVEPSAGESPTLIVGCAIAVRLERLNSPIFGQAFEVDPRLTFEPSLQSVHFGAPQQTRALVSGTELRLLSVSCRSFYSDQECSNSAQRWREVMVAEVENTSAVSCQRLCAR